MSNANALFEFSEPDERQKWIAKPGRQTAFPLSIRNETGEGHDMAVCVEEPANWAWAMPQRISLDPGDLTTVSIVFSPSRETTIAAGEHRAAIRLRDLEGVIFAECTRVFEVEERQELAMTVGLRGPLMSFGLAEGFVLHCTLANRGNVDVTVTPSGDPHPSLVFSKRTVQVPFQGEVSFDIEARWNASQRSNHPEMVTLRAPYRDGEATASIEWRYIAEALEPFMPIYSTAQEEDELLSLSWMQQPEARLLQPLVHSFGDPEHANDADGDGEGAPPAVRPNGSATPAQANGQAADAPLVAQPAGVAKTHDSVLQRPPPLRFPSSRQAQYTYGRRLNPWWPIVQKSGGKWRIKPLPLLLLVIASEGMIIGVQQSQHDAFEAAAGGKIMPIARALRMVPDTAAAIVGFGRHAILVTFHGAHPLHPKPSTRVAARATPAAAARPKPKARKPVAKQSVKHPAHKPAALAATTLSHPANASARSGAGSGRAVAAQKASISALSARYVDPKSLVVSFKDHGLTNLQLTVADGSKIIYNQPQLVSTTLHISVPQRWYHPLLVSLVGSARGGVVVQRRVFVWKPGVR